MADNTGVRKIKGAKYEASVDFRAFSHKTYENPFTKTPLITIGTISEDEG